MNNFPFRTLLFVASAALVFSGCSQNQARPDPSATILGPQTGGMGLDPSLVTVNPDLAPDLVSRPPGVIETADMIRGLIRPVYFAFDSSAIRPDERGKLQELKAYLDSNPNHRVLLEGYCDWRGTAEYNLSLGDRRAAAAKSYLTQLGVNASRIETLSKGSLESARNGDDAAMQNDRRVELVILKR